MLKIPEGIMGYHGHMMATVWFRQLRHLEDSFFYCKTHGAKLNMGVSKNRGTPKLIVYNGKPY